MNIGLVTREYPPFFGGGIGTYTRRWAMALLEQGHRPVVVTVSDDGTERRKTDAGFTVVRLPFLKGNDWSRPHPAITTPQTLAAMRAFHPVSVFAMQVAAALPRLAAEFGLEAVEFPDTGALGWFAMNERRLGRGLEGIPMVVVVHSPSAWVAELNGERVGPREKAMIAMEAECAAWADGVVFLSDSLRRWTHGRWSPRAAVTLPLALGDQEAVARRAREEGGGGEAGRIVFVGRLELRKGLDTLIPAFGRAVAGGADLRLDLVGQDMTDPRTRGPHGAGLVEGLAAGARGRVTFVGKVLPEEVAARRASARIAVVPSPTDNYPSTCVEAMAAGRVVVAADVGGMREMIRDGECGLLFPPGDAAACAAMLTRAAGMRPEEAAAMGRAAAGRILELCGNARIAAARAADFGGLSLMPHAEARPAVLVVDARCAGEPPGELLGAVRGGVIFAHGWTRDGTGTVTALGTPGPGLAAGAAIGPLAVEAALAARHGVRAGAGGTARVPDTRAVAASLVAAGARGAVAPQVVSDVRSASVASRLWKRLLRR